MALKFIFSLIIVSFGAFFLLIGSIGLIRLPDFYARAHATSKSDTLGIMLVIAGLIIFEGFTVNSAKLLIMIIFVALTNPTATNALTRAAFKFRLRPWFKKDKKETNKRKSR